MTFEKEFGPVGFSISTPLSACAPKAPPNKGVNRSRRSEFVMTALRSGECYTVKRRPGYARRYVLG
jgi:hypothetical protein